MGKTAPKAARTVRIVQCATLIQGNVMNWDVLFLKIRHQIALVCSLHTISTTDDVMSFVINCPTLWNKTTSCLLYWKYHLIAFFGTLYVFILVIKCLASFRTDLRFLLFISIRLLSVGKFNFFFLDI